MPSKSGGGLRQAWYHSRLLAVVALIVALAVGFATHSQAMGLITSVAAHNDALQAQTIQSQWFAIALSWASGPLLLGAAAMAVCCTIVGFGSGGRERF